jgi:hypothetical protein
VDAATGGARTSQPSAVDAAIGGARRAEASASAADAATDIARRAEASASAADAIAATNQTVLAANRLDTTLLSVQSMILLILPHLE